MCAFTFAFSLAGLRSLLPERGIVLWLYSTFLSRLVCKQLHAQGTGRHSKDEIMSICVHNINAIREYLGKVYFYEPADTLVILLHP